jgi:hypothetical protein
MRLRRATIGALGLGISLGLTSCSSLKITSSSSGPPAVVVSFAVPQQSAQASVAGGLARMSMAPSDLHARALISTTEGDTTLIVAAVEVVVQEVELQQAAATADCTVTPAGQTTDSDECDEVLLGPAISDLPVVTPGSSKQVALGSVKQTTYSSLWFRLHRLDPNDPNDAQLIGQRPELEGASIHMTGSWNGKAFSVGLALQQTEKLAFQQAVTLGDGSQLAVGVTVDVLSWFKDPDTGHLIDPTTLATDSAAQAKVAANIAASLSVETTQI